MKQVITLKRNRHLKGGPYFKEIVFILVALASLLFSMAHDQLFLSELSVAFLVLFLAGTSHFLNKNAKSTKVVHLHKNNYDSETRNLKRKIN